jgi:inhibitor of KinA sporulation pathway (predicted exonuclease)
MRRLIIVDLEATCWDRSENRSFREMEIIEIGAVLIDINKAGIISEFDEFVKPVNNPVLSNFCRNLTTIRQEDVDQADIFPNVWNRFLKWMETPENVLMSSWGKYDYYQFKLDCTLYRLEYPFENRHINLKDLLYKKMGRRRFGLSFALKKLGLKFEGTRHRGLDDALNIWEILKKASNGDPKNLLHGYLTEQLNLFRE